MSSVARIVCVVLLVNSIWCLEFNETLPKEVKRLEKRNVLTFPPDSVFQINMGVSLSGDLDKNNAVIVLAFQQNLPLPKETQPTVVSARQFSIFHHLRDVIDSYGYSGTQCLGKMVCQIATTPLLGGLMEDVITFALTWVFWVWSNHSNCEYYTENDICRPSKHRSAQYRQVEKEGHSLVKMLLESERLGKLGGNCSSAFPECSKTPLDFISASVR